MPASPPRSLVSLCPWREEEEEEEADAFTSATAMVSLVLNLGKTGFSREPMRWAAECCWLFLYFGRLPHMETF